MTLEELGRGLVISLAVTAIFILFISFFSPSYLGFEGEEVKSSQETDVSYGIDDEKSELEEKTGLISFKYIVHSVEIRAWNLMLM